MVIKPKLSDFLLDLHRFLAHKGFAKIAQLRLQLNLEKRLFNQPIAAI